MTLRGLTARQRDVLGFLTTFMVEHGYAPSLREIAAHLGISAPKNAAKHLAALERKGFIRRPPGLSRAVELIGAAGAAGGRARAAPGPPGKRLGIGIAPHDLLPGVISVPVAGNVRAGEPHLAVEDITGRVMLDERFFRCRGAFLLRVEGESMVGAGIDDGDYVVVRPQKAAANGEVVVALVDGEATVKRFFRRAGEIALMPENPAFEPLVIRAGGPEVELVGIVVSVVRRMEQ